MKKVEKPKPKGPKPTDNNVVEPRRSSRARHTVSSYLDDDDDFIRPVEEVKVASYEESSQVNKHAKKLQINLQTGNPSFVKSTSGAQNYEDVRKLRLLENKRRFEELGLAKLSRGLADMKKVEKTKRQYVQPKGPKPTDINATEPRRSSRVHNAVSSKAQLWIERYLERPVKEASYEERAQISRYAQKLQSKLQARKERAQAYKYAEKLQRNLQAGNPSFVKSMHPSYVGNNAIQMFLPLKFCEDHLPKSTVDLVLENEEGSEYGAVYISNRTAFGGLKWRVFALDHKLAECDALVFELIAATRFKVYIVRACDVKDQNVNLSASEVESDAEETLKRETKEVKKVSSPELQESMKSKKDTKNVSSPELQDSTKSKIKNSSQVSAPRRSLRKRELIL